MMIVKIQRSKFTTAPKPQMLIYNRAKTVNVETDLDPRIDKMMGDRDKVYAKASIKKSNLHIGDFVADQGW